MDREETSLCKCGKVSFPNRQLAISVCKRMANRKLPRRRHSHRRTVLVNSANPKDLHVYQCGHGLWHVGHKRKERGDGTNGQRAGDRAAGDPGTDLGHAGGPGNQHERGAHRGGRGDGSGLDVRGRDGLPGEGAVDRVERVEDERGVGRDGSEAE